MKLNLNTIILDSRSFLAYIYENNQIKHLDYDKHVEQNKSRWDLIYFNILSLSDDIDMYPYFYTLDVVNEKERYAFFKFFCNYIDKQTVDYQDKTLSIETSINNIAGNSLENIALFIITMQYFFL